MVLLQGTKLSFGVYETHLLDKFRKLTKCSSSLQAPPSRPQLMVCGKEGYFALLELARPVLEE